jgi:murein DD-endopeptidase MepM/ murein hydrolase activator NlpD
VVRFERFDAAPSGALLGLSLRMPHELPSHARPTLMIERDGVELLYEPRIASICSLLPAQDAWLWRGIFSVPGELCGDPALCFSLRVHMDLFVALPLPVPASTVQRGPQAAGIMTRPAGRSLAPYVLRRGTLLLIVTCQLCLLGVLRLPLAAAESASSPVAITESSEAPGSSSTQAGSTPSAGASPAAPPAGASGGPSAGSPAEAAPSSAPGESEQVNVTVQAPKAAPSVPPGQDGASGAQIVPVTTVKDGSSTSTRPATGTGSPDSANDQRAAHRLSGGPHAAGDRKPQSRTPVGAAETAPPASPGESGLGSAFIEAGAPFGLPPGLTGFGESGPPDFLIPMYEAAGRRYDVPWRVLAAINAVETDYGRNLSVSSAGAVGWMQFMPETWREWGIDADRSGSADPYSPMDAIFSAARYLQANGAAQDLPAAIFAYNHAGWYVTEVLLRARALESDLTATDSERGYALPLDAPYMRALGRTDDGVDIETAPDGALVYSMTPGIVTAVASDPAGFGPNYPVIEATTGSLAGEHVYYGHVALALVRAGQQVSPGQPIAVMGHTGDAAGMGHGHIEIGFSDATGDPLNHHGVEAATPAGELMRGFLVTLDDAVERRHAVLASRHARALAAAHRLRATRSRLARLARAREGGPGGRSWGRRLK